jgi:hypothetical protein
MLARQQQKALGLNYGLIVALHLLFLQSLLLGSTWYFILHLMVVQLIPGCTRPGLHPFLWLLAHIALQLVLLRSALLDTMAVQQLRQPLHVLDYAPLGGIALRAQQAVIKTSVLLTRPPSQARQVAPNVLLLLPHPRQVN